MRAQAPGLTVHVPVALLRHDPVDFLQISPVLQLRLRVQLVAVDARDVAAVLVFGLPPLLSFPAPGQGPSVATFLPALLAAHALL